MEIVSPEAICLESRMHVRMWYTKVQVNMIQVHVIGR